MIDNTRTNLLGKWLLFVSVLVVYGSLFPFEFGSPSPEWWSRLLKGSVFEGRSPGDILGNIALFLPIGFLGGLLLTGARNHVVSFVGLLFGGLLLASLSQVLQLFVPSRDPSMADVVWNAIGLLVGFGVAWLISASGTLVRLSVGLRSLPTMLVGCWLAAELIPMVPSLDLQQFKDSLKPLFVAPRFSAGTALLASASVLLLAEALGQLVGLRRAPYWLAVSLLLAASLKVLVVTVSLDLATVVGWTVGALLWIVLATGRVRDRPGALVLATLIALMVAAFEPFRLASPPTRMNLLPFGSFLDGHMLANARVLLGKFFLFAGLMWIARSRVQSLLPVALGLASLVLVLELMQIFVDGRVASIDEPLLVLFAGIAVAQWERLTGEVAQGNQARHPTVSLKSSAQRPQSGEGWAARKLPRVRHFRRTLYTMLVLGGLIFLALRLPGLPYNVRELLDGDGGIFYATVFGLAILWIGIGGYWVGQVVALRDFPILVLPAASLLGACRQTGDFVPWSRRSELSGAGGALRSAVRPTCRRAWVLGRAAAKVRPRLFEWALAARRCDRDCWLASVLQVRRFRLVLNRQSERACRSCRPVRFRWWGLSVSVGGSGRHELAAVPGDGQGATPPDSYPRPKPCRVTAQLVLVAAGAASGR